MTDSRPLTLEIARMLIEQHTQSIRDERLAQNPLVSVCLITHNHKPFVQQALDGVLEQETSFPFEVVIGDDCSDDGTTDIVLDFHRQHPQTVRVLLARENLGRHTGNGRLNFLRTIQAARGRYSAIIEGDDYWTDPLKLQKQVDFLETNPEFALCFHNAHFLCDVPGLEQDRPLIEDVEQEVFHTRDLLREWFIPTASIVFRRYEGFEFPEWFLHTQSGDIPLLLLPSLKGPFRYLNEIMSVWRRHAGGVSIGHTGRKKAIAMTYMYQCFNIETSYAYDAEISSAIMDELHSYLPELVRLQHLEQELVKLETAYENSLSLRTGRTLTWPLRKLSKLFRSE